MPQNLAESTVVVNDNVPISVNLSQVDNPAVENFYDSLVQRALQAETDAQRTPGENLLIENIDLEVNANPDVLLMSHDAAGTPVILGTVGAIIDYLDF